jgi:hypothetical protein
VFCERFRVYRFVSQIFSFHGYTPYIVFFLRANTRAAEGQSAGFPVYAWGDKALNALRPRGRIMLNERHFQEAVFQDLGGPGIALSGEAKLFLNPAERFITYPQTHKPVRSLSRST